MCEKEEFCLLATSLKNKIFHVCVPFEELSNLSYTSRQGGAHVCFTFLYVNKLCDDRCTRSCYPFWGSTWNQTGKVVIYRDGEMISPVSAPFPYPVVFCSLREGYKPSWKVSEGHFYVDGPLNIGSYVKR